jgi:hypothetical protein
MSTKSDYKAFSNIYDSLYTEDADYDSAEISSVDPGTTASTGPATGDLGPRTTGAISALMALQSEIQKIGLGSDAQVIEHIQGLSSILRPSA